MSEERVSNASASDLRATFTDYDNNFAPYEGRAVRLSLVADVLFVAVGKLTEDRDSERFECVSDDVIGVDAELLYETLGAMLRRSDRHARAMALEGTLRADDPRLSTMPVEVSVPATRRRA